MVWVGWTAILCHESDDGCVGFAGCKSYQIIIKSEKYDEGEEEACGGQEVPDVVVVVKVEKFALLTEK